MYHSIKIGEKGATIDTYADWHLVADSRPLVSPPSPKFKTLEIPGASGLIDISTSLTGYPVFENRTGSWTFYVLNNDPQNNYGEWFQRYSQIMNFCHGKKLKIWLEDEPDWYYEGRLSVNDWKSDKDWSKITIDYNLDPYKRYWSPTDGEGYVYGSYGSDVVHTITQENYGYAPVIPEFRLMSPANATITMHVLDTNTDYTITTKASDPAVWTKYPSVVWYGSKVTLKITGATVTLATRMKKGSL